MMRPLSSQAHDSVLASGLNVLVFRVAESPACQEFQPELEAFVRARPQCLVWTVEAMQQRDLADRHGLRALPSIVVYLDGLPARRFAGGISADDLIDAVDEVSAADMQTEYNDWMVWMMETGEAGSPFIGLDPASPGRSSSETPTSTALSRPFLSTNLAQPLSSLRPSSGAKVGRPAQPRQQGYPAAFSATRTQLNDLRAGNEAWYAGEEDAAIRHFTAVLQDNPSSVDALNGRGQVFADSGAGEAALADLDRMLACKPDPNAAAYARSARALALAQVGRREDAVQEIVSALTATPGNAWAHLRQARIHLLHGNDHSSVESSLRRALEANEPPLTRSQRALAESLL